MSEAFGVTVKELEELMAHRGKDSVSEVNKFGGVDGLCYLLQTNPISGLCDIREVSKRVKHFGINYIPPKLPKTFIQLLWNAMQDLTLMILEACAIVSLLFSSFVSSHEEEGDTGWIEGLAILISVIVVITVAAFTDYQKEKQFRSLQQKIESDQIFTVLRCNIIQQIPNTNIVVGDICFLNYGDVVPVDGVLIQSSELKMDESSLTGESDLVKKSVTEDMFILSGTYVMEGSGKMIVTAVGPNSQSGIIFQLLSTQNENDGFERSVLQSKLSKLAIQIGYGGLIVAGLTVIYLVVQFCIVKFAIEGNEWHSMYLNNLIEFLLLGVTMLVVAVPEGLPLAVTLALAYSVKKMMKDNNLVRHLDACETMGNATAICTDKTGTLTTNRMTVVRSYICGTLYRTNSGLLKDLPYSTKLILAESIAFNTARTSQLLPIFKALPKQIGNKTECALLQFLNAFGMNYQQIRNRMSEDNYTRVFTFNSNRKSMTTVIPLPDHKGFRVFCKGAPEIILKKCSHILTGELKYEQFTKHAEDIDEVIEDMANESLRTLCLAYKDMVYSKNTSVQQVISETPKWSNENEVMANLVFLCVVGIEDPVRDEVPESIKMCQKAGIVVRMVTGDNEETARSIALKCGILRQGFPDIVLDGKTFNEMVKEKDGTINQEKFDLLLPNLRVLARSTPSDKFVLVTGILNSNLKKYKEVVAVTGDGTNDAPALKKADVGFAMGISGTSVAKEASDIIVTDDNFSSIVKAVLWGRNVYDSIAKFIQFQLTVNIVAMSIVILSAIAIQDSPLKAVQMLWINLVMDTLASLALAAEPPHPCLMKRKPYGRTSPLVSPTMVKNIIGHSVFQLVVILTLLFTGESYLGLDSSKKGRGSQLFTFIFNTFVLLTLFNEINARKIHGERNVLAQLWMSPVFCVIWLMSLLGQILIVQFGGLAFSTVPLYMSDWMWSVLFGTLSLLWGQVLASIPVTVLPAKLRWGVKESVSNEDISILKIRSTKRLRQSNLDVAK